MIKVLVIYDDFSISSAIAYALEREGFTVEISVDGEEALEKVTVFKPDVIILDVLMPRISGYEVYRKLDTKNRPLVLLLTVKNDIVDKVLGLELGADDYLTKPFDIREVLTRVKALYEQKNLPLKNRKEPEEEAIHLGGILIELYSRSVWMDGEELDFARGMIYHSDRGSQFTSHAFRESLAKRSAIQSMSGTGR